MTTCAWDGKYIGADTLGEQQCLKVYNKKIYEGQYVIMAGAGNRHQIISYWKRVKDMTAAEIIEFGYPDYDPDKDYPAMILVNRHAFGAAWMLTGSEWTGITRGYHAIGSGRDFALAAMRLGLGAKEAIEIAAEFDVYTGGPIDIVKAS